MLWAEHTFGAEHAMFISVTLVYVYRPSTMPPPPQMSSSSTSRLVLTLCMGLMQMRPWCYICTSCISGLIYTLFIFMLSVILFEFRMY